MLKDSIFYFISKMLPGIINLLTIYIYTRMLTTSEYGEYSLYITVVSIIYATFFEWLRLSLLRFYKKHTKIKNTFLGTIGTLNLLIFISLFILGIFLAIINYFYKIEYININVLLIILLLIIAQIFFNISKTIARANMKPKLFGLINVGKSLLTLLFSVLLFKLNLGIYGIMIGIFVGILIPSLPLVVREFKTVKMRYNKHLAKEIIGYGVPLIFTLVMAIGLYSIDRLMLAYYIDLEEVGRYSAAYTIAQQSIFFLMTVVNLASFPIILNALEKKKQTRVNKEMEKNYNFLMLISVPSLFGVIALSSNIIHVMLGKEYYSVSNIVFPLISLGVFFQGIKLYYFDLPFHLSSNTKLQRIPVLIALILNFLLNLFFIPKYGAIGAAITTNISFIVSMVISWYLGKSLFKLPFSVSNTIKILLASIIMYLVVVSINHLQGILYLLLQITVGAFVYFIMVFILNIANINYIIRNKGG